MKHAFISYRAACMIGIFLLSLVGVTLWQQYVQSERVLMRSMSEELLRIRDLLVNIDEECEISNIAHERSYIDFLSVTKFAGSRIGPLKLKHPDKWTGPYLQKVPLAQGKMYELIKMRDGYGIVPGSGVRLANGKVIGVDIVFDVATDIDTYLTAEVGLEFEHNPLIVKFVPKMYKNL